tara:strand:+ start:406 stop:708 length:303 start_codon:yes stop_codon:yes gene_type:complete
MEKKKKYVSGASGYDPSKSKWDSKLKAIQQNPISEIPYSKKGPFERSPSIEEIKSGKHDKNVSNKARQIQIQDFQKKSLTLNTMKKGGKIKDFRGNKQHD